VVSCSITNSIPPLSLAAQIGMKNKGATLLCLV